MLTTQISLKKEKKKKFAKFRMWNLVERLYRSESEFRRANQGKSMGSLAQSPYYRAALAPGGFNNIIYDHRVASHRSLPAHVAESFPQAPLARLRDRGLGRRIGLWIPAGLRLRRRN